MKTKNKALLLALCAMSLVTASVLGTMAYLTDNKKVTNTFTVGSVAITMDETKVSDDGTPDANADPVKENKYKLLPGHEYTKDPTIRVDSKSEDCYLFVEVDNQIAAIESKETGKSVADQMAAKGWKPVKDNVYVYVGTAAGASDPLAVKASDKITVFEKIKIDGSVNGTELKKYDGKNITVTAYAVQKDGFEKMNATQIWETAFPKA